MAKKKSSFSNQNSKNLKKSSCRKKKKNYRWQGFFLQSFDWNSYGLFACYSNFAWLIIFWFKYVHYIHYRKPVFCNKTTLLLSMKKNTYSHWLYRSFYARKMQAQYWNHFWYQMSNRYLWQLKKSAEKAKNVLANKNLHLSFSGRNFLWAGC